MLAFMQCLFAEITSNGATNYKQNKYGSKCINEVIQKKAKNAVQTNMEQIVYPFH